MVCTFQVFQLKSWYAFLISPIHFPCLAHVIHLDLIMLIIFGENTNFYSHTKQEINYVWQIKTNKS
jgi:hypothetical protein